MGLMDRLTGEQAEDDPDGGEVGLELDDGGLDGLGDGLDGGDDLSGLGGDGDDDMFDDGGTDTQAIADLDDRVGEAENELADLSSTVTTIRQENKEIGDTVDELEEKIRKLLDIYEMVTRGINPFVDDAREMDGVDGGGTFELFDMETGPTDDQDSLDSDLAEAEADEFFADDLGEFEPDPGVSQAEAAAEEKLDEQNDAGDFEAKMEAVEEAHAPEDGPEDEADDGGDESADGGDESTDGMSFDELKAEYEEGDADWASDLEGGADDDDQDDAEDSAEDDAQNEDRAEDGDRNQGEERNETPEDDSGDEAEEAVVDTDDSMFFEEQNSGPSRAGRPDPGSPAPSAEPETAPASAATTAEHPDESASEYLVTSLPSDFLTELLLLEWVSVMVERCGVGGTTRTLGRYERVGWLAPPVRETLETYVHRLGARRGAAEPDGHAVEDVGVDFHADSIDFLKRLAEPGETSPERVRQQLRRL
ncbi:MAG: flagella accessory protein C [Halorientalis sp.]